MGERPLSSLDGSTGEPPESCCLQTFRLQVSKDGRIVSLMNSATAADKNYSSATHYIVSAKAGARFAVLAGPYYPHAAEEMTRNFRTYKATRPHDALSCVASFDLDAMREKHERDNIAAGYAEANDE